MTHVMTHVLRAVLLLAVTNAWATTPKADPPKAEVASPVQPNKAAAHPAKADAPKAEVAKANSPKANAVKANAVKADAPKANARKSTDPSPSAASETDKHTSTQPPTATEQGEEVYTPHEQPLPAAVITAPEVTETEAPIIANKLVEADDKTPAAQKYSGMTWFVGVFLVLLIVVFAFT